MDKNEIGQAMWYEAFRGEIGTLGDDQLDKEYERCLREDEQEKAIAIRYAMKKQGPGEPSAFKRMGTNLRPSDGETWDDMLFQFYWLGCRQWNMAFRIWAREQFEERRNSGADRHSRFVVRLQEAREALYDGNYERFSELNQELSKL